MVFGLEIKRNFQKLKPDILTFKIQFMLPGLMHIAKQTYRQRGDGPALCVLLPTRELAQQVQAVRFFI